MTFAESISGEEPRIWFECQNELSTDPDDEQYIIEDADDPAAGPVVYGRETRVVWIKVFRDGKLSSYSCLDSFNLGYFAKMTDEEIIEELETNTTSFISGQKDEPYDIYLYTDPTGQEVEYEGVPALIRQGRKEKPIYYMTLLNSGGMIPTFRVYDSFYGGYELYNYDETPYAEACIVTRCSEDDSFSADGTELEGGILDYKNPEDLLTELNSPKDEKKKQ